MEQELGQQAYLGLDTHKETIHGTALNKNGEIICSYEFNNGEEAMKEFLKSFKPWNTSIAIEACGIWRGCYRILRKLGYNEVKLANPLKCHQIAKDKKTDEVDSKILADLLRTNFLPEVFIPSEEILKLRDLVRHKCNLTRLRVRIQNKIKACLLREGIHYERGIWNKEGLSWLKELSDEKIEDFVDVYETIKKKERKTWKKIEDIVRMKEETALLKTIPGVGYLGAAMIYAEIGNIKRFKTIKQLHAYAGVAPGIQQSGTKTRMPKRKQVNYWLKWVVGECAGKATIIESNLQKYYFRVRNKKGWRTGRKATARKILTLTWHILTKNEPYHTS